MTQASDLQARVTFQQRGLDTNGDRLGAWTDDFKRWAQEMPLRGRITGDEIVMQGRLKGIQATLFTVRADCQTLALTSAWRLRFRATPFNIRQVTPRPDRVWVDILAESDSSNGGA